jgi:RHS repeat-associated protein
MGARVLGDVPLSSRKGPSVNRHLLQAAVIWLGLFSCVGDAGAQEPPTFDINNPAPAAERALVVVEFAPADSTGSPILPRGQEGPSIQSSIDYYGCIVACGENVPVQEFICPRYYETETQWNARFMAPWAGYPALGSNGGGAIVPRNAHALSIMYVPNLTGSATSFTRVYNYALMNDSGQWLYWLQASYYFSGGSGSIVLSDSFGNRVTYGAGGPSGFVWWNFGLLMNCKMLDGRYWIYNQSECEVVYRPIYVGGGPGAYCPPPPTPSPSPVPTVRPTATPRPTPRPTASPSPTPTPAPNAPTTAPTAHSPRGCVTASPGSTFSWSTVEGATKYQLLILRDRPDGGTDVVLSREGTQASFAPAGLEAGLKYRWKVRAGNSAGFGPYSDGGQGVEFVLGCGHVVAEAPLPLSPAGCPISPASTFSWQGLMAASQYVLRIRDVDTNETVQYATTATSYTPAQGTLRRGHRYAWSVAGRALNQSMGPFSPDWLFCIEAPVLPTDPDLKPPVTDLDCFPPPPPAAVGHPVTVTSGNMYLDQVDIAVPGIGPALVFSRSFNSENRFHHGALGLGWTHSFEQRLTLATADVPDDQIILYLGDGTARYFWDQGREGTYEAYVPAAEESSFKRVTGTFVRQFREGGSETYDAQGRLTRITDRLGLSLTIARAANGRIESITNASGRALRLTHYANGALQRVAGPGDLVTVDYLYYPQPFPIVNLYSVIYRDGSGYTFTYNSDYRLEKVTDASGRVLEAHTYYPDGRAATSSLAEGRDNLTLQYETNRTLVTDALGNVTTYEFAEVNRTRRVVRTVGPCASCGGGGSQEQKWTYDSAGRVASREDVGGKITRYQYDAVTGDLLFVKDPLLNTTAYTYYPDGRVKTITTPENSTKAFVYGSAGPETVTESITSRLSRSTRVEYDANTGLPMKTFDARGKATTYEYDPTTHDLLAVRGPMNAPPKKPSSRFEYDPMGRLKTVWDALDRPTSMTYDNHGRVKTVTYPDNTTAEFGYDMGGRRTSVTDALGRTASSVYDRFGRLEATQDPLRNVTRQDYDLMSRLTSLTDAEGRTTRFEYDGYGRLTRTVYPGGGIESRSYNQEGWLSSSTDRAGVTTTYVYDALGRLVSNAYSNQAPATSFEYDVMGRVKSMTKAGETLSWTYDHLGRMLTEASTSSTRPASTVSYTYDDSGNRLSLKLDDVVVASYTYDDVSRLDLIRHAGMDFDFEYDDASRRSSLSYPNGVLTTYDLSDMGRLRRVDARKGSAVIADFQYGYDNIGNRTSKTWPGSSESYAYDELSRLTRVSRTGAEPRRSSFSYDRVGNRLVDSSNETVLSGQHNERNQLISKDLGGIVPVEGHLDEPGQVQIDGQPARIFQGNRFAGQISTTPGAATEFTVTATDGRTPVTRRFGLDISGQPASMIYSVNGNLLSKTEGGFVWTYEWTVDNQLRRVLRDNVEIARFTYDPLGRRVEKVAGGITYTWLYDGQDILRETATSIDGTQTRLYLHGPGVDEPLARKDVATGAMTYYHADGLGSIIKLTDSNAAAVHTYQYDAWGTIEVGASTSGYAFTGREWDPETGLYYYRARYYDPRLGIFISEDPAKDGSSFYAYVNGNPVNAVDPMGLWGVQIGGVNLGVGQPSLIFDEDAVIAGSKGAQGALDAFTFGLMRDFLDSTWQDSGQSGIQCDRSFQTGNAWGKASRTALQLAAYPLLMEKLAAQGFFRVGAVITQRAMKPIGSPGHRWFSEMLTRHLIQNSPRLANTGRGFKLWLTTFKYGKKGAGGEVVLNWLTGKIIHTIPF